MIRKGGGSIFQISLKFKKSLKYPFFNYDTSPYHLFLNLLSNFGLLILIYCLSLLLVIICYNHHQVQSTLMVKRGEKHPVCSNFTFTVIYFNSGHFDCIILTEIHFTLTVRECSGSVMGSLLNSSFIFTGIGKKMCT